MCPDAVAVFTQFQRARASAKRPKCDLYADREAGAGAAANRWINIARANFSSASDQFLSKLTRLSKIDN